MVAGRSAKVAGSIGRIIAALSVLVALAPGKSSAQTTVPPHQVEVEDLAQLEGGDPGARLQIVIKSVNVSNDRDGFWTGSGEILLMASFWRCSGLQPPCSASEDNPARLVAYARKSFNADEGDMEVLNRVVPLADDVRDSSVASEASGIAVHDGADYLLEINAFERDAVGGDFMGGIQRVINQSNNWGIGLHSQEPAGFFADTSLPPTEDSFLCAGCGDIIVGDYLVTYEIRKTPLPDLDPTQIEVHVEAGDGANDAVCVTVRNAGREESPSFRVNIYLDNSMPPNGSFGMSPLAPGASDEECVRTSLPTTGLHRLSAIVDQNRLVLEMDEKNNSIDRSLILTPLSQNVADDLIHEAMPDTSPGTPPSRDPIVVDPAGPLTRAPESSPTPTGPGSVLTAPAPAANLEVKAIRVKGKNPSSSNDCDVGENDVTVVVKNEGNAPAASFLVRLVVGNQTKDKSATNLAANAEANVTFDDIMLTAGQHKLTATADVQGGAASKEDDGKLEVTVACANE